MRARSSRLVPAPVHQQRSCGISRPGRDSIRVMLVVAYDKRVETPVYATAAVAGRPQVCHFSGRPRMLLPLGANLLGGAPIRLTTSGQDCPFGQLGENKETACRPRDRPYGRVCGWDVCRNQCQGVCMCARALLPCSVGWSLSWDPQDGPSWQAVHTVARLGEGS